MTIDTLADVADVKRWLLSFTDTVVRRADELTELDRLVGDGDFGWNVSSALQRALPGVQAATGTPSAALDAVANSFLAAGGTSGPLLGLWFDRLAANRAPHWSARDLADGIGRATAAIQRLGGAAVGDKTMVDAMAPAAAALESAADSGWDAALVAAASAAAVGAESTRALIASRGRASYVGEHARDVVDPGALAIAWFFAAGVQDGPR